ncbi:replication protein [Providencia rettgeri]
MTDKREANKAGKSRRGLQKYKENPFIMAASVNTKGGTRKIIGKNDKLMVVSEETGERIGGAGFFQYYEVDQTQFLKLYVNGVKALTELTSAGTKVFEVLYRAVQENKDNDKIFLAFDLIDQNIIKISESTFYRGMKELIKKDFIAETTIQNCYFLNPDYIFNGDRLSFVKSFILKKSEPEKIENKK